MRGEPIESVKVGLEAMVSSLRQDPFALESVCISIITFDREVRQILPLTPLDELQLPEITTPESGPTHTGQALKLGIINKAFEPFERQLAADTVWARIPQDAGRGQLFGV